MARWARRQAGKIALVAPSGRLPLPAGQPYLPGYYVMLPFDAYVGLKDLIGSITRLSPDALHVHLGLVVFVAAAVALRTERRWLHALGLLLVVCMVNEAMDLAIDYRHGDRLRWLNGIKDIVNTMGWPAVWVVCRPLIIRTLASRPGSRFGRVGVESPIPDTLGNRSKAG